MGALICCTSVGFLEYRIFKCMTSIDTLVYSQWDIIKAK